MSASPEPGSPVYDADTPFIPTPDELEYIEVIFCDLELVVKHVRHLQDELIQQYSFDPTDMDDDFFKVIENSIQMEVALEFQTRELSPSNRFSLVALAFYFPMPRPLLNQLKSEDFPNITGMIEMQAVVRAAQLSRAIVGAARQDIMRDTIHHAKELALSFSPSLLEAWPHLTLAVAVALLRLGIAIPLSFSTIPRVADIAYLVYRPRTPKGGRIPDSAPAVPPSSEQLEDRLPLDVAAFLRPCVRCNPFTTKGNKPHMLCYSVPGTIKCYPCTNQHRSGCANQLANLSNPHFKRMVIPREIRSMRLGGQLRASLAGRAAQVLELAAFSQLDTASVANEAASIPSTTIVEELHIASRELFDAFCVMFEAATRAEAAGVDTSSFLSVLKLKAFANPEDL